VGNHRCCCVRVCQPPVCADCGVALPRAARFWPESGQPVAAAPAPASYTPRHISEQILAVRSAIEGERKQVSVHVWEAASSLKRENCSGAQCAQRATLGTYEGTSHAPINNVSAFCGVRPRRPTASRTRQEGVGDGG
jgi:hypothetical protein